MILCSALVALRTPFILALLSFPFKSIFTLYFVLNSSIKNYVSRQFISICLILPFKQHKYYNKMKNLIIAENFTRLSQQILDQVNVINSFKACLININKKLQLSSQSYEDHYSFHQNKNPQYETLRLQIKGKLNQLGEKNEEILKIMDYKITQLIKFVQRRQLQDQNGKANLAEKYKIMIKDQQENLRNDVDKQNQEKYKTKRRDIKNQKLSDLNKISKKQLNTYKDEEYYQISTNQYDKDKDRFFPNNYRQKKNPFEKGKYGIQFDKQTNRSNRSDNFQKYTGLQYCPYLQQKNRKRIWKLSPSENVLMENTHNFEQLKRNHNISHNQTSRLVHSDSFHFNSQSYKGANKQNFQDNFENYINNHQQLKNYQNQSEFKPFNAKGYDRFKD